MTLKNHKLRLFTISTALLISLFLTGCVTTTNKRLDQGDIDSHALTDRWNAEDSKRVANKMVNDLFDFPWLKRFNRENPGKRPVIVIHRITNKSHEHIAVDTFVNDVKRAIIRSDLADFKVAGEELAALRGLKLDDIHTMDPVELGRELGANFMLSGSINSMVDQMGRERVTSYQIDMKLVNVESAREAWNGSEKISKHYKRGLINL